MLLPVLALGDACLFPESSLEVTVPPVALRPVEVARRCGDRLLVVALRESGGQEMCDVGTVARLVEYHLVAEGGARLELDGEARARKVSVVGVECPLAEVQPLPEGEAGAAFSDAVEALARFVHAHQKLRTFLEQRRRSQEPMAWVNMVCQHLPIKLATRQSLLEADAPERCQKVGRVLEALLKKEQGP